jgi:hypothetical protein
MKQIVFIYSNKNKQLGIPADIASVPLCDIDDKDQRTIAYVGTLWECQVPEKDKVEFDQKIKAKPVYIAYSEPVEDIDKWLSDKGYKRVVVDDGKEIK